MLKPFSGEKNSKSCRNGAPKRQFLGKMGVQTLDIGFATPKRHFLARNRVIWHILRQNRCASRLWPFSRTPPPKKSSWVTLCRRARNHACAEPKPQNWFGYHRFRGFWVAGGQISPFLIDSSSPLQHSRVRVWWCTVVSPTSKFVVWPIMSCFADWSKCRH